MTTEITYDEALVAEIAARFDLRKPNEMALREIVRRLAANEAGYEEMIADLATGVGKTYLMSSLIEYLAEYGVRNVLVVTPGSVIQRKTLENFNSASAKYVPGAEIEPSIITPENFQAANVGAVMRDPRRLKVFVFNVQQLISPTVKTSRKTREDDENLGAALYEHLEEAEDLFIIADEHHIYREKAKAFSAAIRELHPVSLVGLTATPDKADLSKVVFQYTLGEAIADGHVKVPVIVYRKDGTKDERTQLADACQLLRNKEQAYATYREAFPVTADVRPVLFVVCQDIAHADEVGALLTQDGFIGDGQQVLQVTSQSSDEALEALASVEQPDSPIRAIVSVNMLREGWDVKNIAVIVALRKLASQTLTEQILGRGLRLPFGKRTGIPQIDQVDLVAHDSYEQLLSQKDVLRQRIHLPSTAVEVDDQGAATTAEVDETQPIAPSEAQETDAGESAGAINTSSGHVSSVPGQYSLLDMGVDEHVEEVTEGDETSLEEGLLFHETGERIAHATPQPKYRVENAPEIIFPRRETRLVPAPFTLADVSNNAAREAGTAFVREVPTFLFRKAIEAERKDGGEVELFVKPQTRTEAQQTLIGLDVVEAELIDAIMRQPEVPQERSSRKGAKRLVAAFLEGAGATSTSATAEWGPVRREQAVEGMRALIRDHIAKRPQQQSYAFIKITLPVEPIFISGDAERAYDATRFRKGLEYVGWERNILPMAKFDAGTTEWELARLLDQDDSIAWWVRLYTNGEAYIPTPNGKYFPDFIAVDTDGVHWLIEGKSDRDANDPDVQRKKEAAEVWARAVRDADEFETWRYVFATETHIKQAAGSWLGLLTATNPEM